MGWSSKMNNASPLLALKYGIYGIGDGNKWYSGFYITNERYSGLQAIQTGQNGSCGRYGKQENP